MNINSIGLLSTFQSIASLIDSTHHRFRSQHLKTAYICSRLGLHLKLDVDQRRSLILASLIHDIGTLTLQERLAIQSVDANQTRQHCEVGFWILNQNPALSEIANIIRAHHLPFSELAKSTIDPKILELAQILHISDRIACRVDSSQLPISSARDILQYLSENVGHLFDPELCKAIAELGKRESFWLDMDHSMVSQALAANLPEEQFVDLDTFEGIAFVLHNFIDFRSEFTIAHTAGVAAIAEKLAEKSHFSPVDIQKIRIAAYLHDIGKYAVPAEILEKPVALSSEEFEVVRATPYFTFHSLAGIKQTDIQAAAGHHHERLDGSGYPFGLKGSEISLGAQIVGLADMLSAMIERRPYRDGKPPAEALGILAIEAEEGKISADLVEIAQKNSSEILEHHASEVDKAFDTYNDYIKSLIYSSAA